MMMAILLLISVFFLSKEAAVVSNETAEKEKVIVIDAGHGGADPGMIGIGGLKEQEIKKCRICRTVLKLWRRQSRFLQ